MRAITRAAFGVAFLIAAATIAADEPTPTADALMRSVVAQLPPNPIALTGELIVRLRRGVVVEQHPFQCFIHWGATPPTARYVLPATGDYPREEIALTRVGDRQEIVYRRGDRDAAAPSLTTRIRQTDLSWLDLTLGFLWWQNPTIVDEASIRGFDCHIVEVPRPPGMESEYAVARLWIGKQQHLLLQAEGVDAEGRVVRRLWVKSCKKIDEKWMIKEMEIQQYPDTQRTRLRILEVAEPPT